VTPALPYSFSYPVFVEWAPPTGDYRNLMYTVVWKATGTRYKKAFPPTALTQITVDEKDSRIRPYGTEEFRVYARAPCETKKRRPNKKTMSKILTVCDDEPSPPFETKNVKTKFQYFFSRKKTVTSHFVFAWHKTHRDEEGTSYEIKEYELSENDEQVTPYTFTVNGKVGRFEKPQVLRVTVADVELRH